MLLYFAGPLFSEAEKRFNQQVTAKIEDLGYRVFLPPRDGVERGQPPYDAMPPDERRRLRFARDKDNVLACDVVLFVLDGRVPGVGEPVQVCGAWSGRAGRLRAPVTASRRRAQVPG